MMKKKVYIASPYTLGDVAVNVKRQIDAADGLIKLGYAPYVPLLSHFVHMAHPHPYNVWMDVGLSWLAECDAVLRLAGESRGSDIEVAFAEEHDIPVFYDIDSLLSTLKAY